MIKDSDPEGKRGASEYPLPKTSSNKIEQMAVRLGWPIDPEDKPKIVARQVEIATADDVSPRANSAAARVLVAMEQQNVAVALSPHIGIVEPQLQSPGESLIPT